MSDSDILNYQPGQTVTFYKEVKNSNGQRTDDGYIPVVTRVVFPGFALAPNYPQTMSRLDVGLYFFQLVIPQGAGAVGTYLVDIVSLDPNSLLLVNDSRQIIVTAPYGNYSTSTVGSGGPSGLPGPPGPIGLTGLQGPAGPGPSGPAAGDLSGAYPDPTVIALQGSPISSTAPIDGYVLTWKAADGYWEPASTTVPNISSLTLLTVPDGQTAFVSSVRSIFRFIADGAQIAVDHITVENTSSGNNTRWVRDDTYSDPVWRINIAHVYLDSVTGNDENQGIYSSTTPPSSPAPLKTAQELARRWGRKQLITSTDISVGTIVHILNPVTPGADRIDVSFLGSPGTYLRFLGENTATLHSGTLDAGDGFTPWNPTAPGGGTPNIIKDSTSGIVWANYISKRIFFPRVNAWAYVLKDLGGNSARISVPQNADEPTFGDPINTFPASGDTYVIDDPVHVNFGLFGVDSFGDWTASGGPFTSINVSNVTLDGGPLQLGPMAKESATAEFYQCVVNGYIGADPNVGPLTYENCRAWGWSNNSADGSAGENYFLGGAIVMDPSLPGFEVPVVEISGGALHTAPLDYDATIQGGFVIALGNVELRAFSVWDSVSSSVVADNPLGHAILVGTNHDHSAPSQAAFAPRGTSIIFGSGNAGVGLYIAPRCTAVLNGPPVNTFTCNITGTLGDFQLGSGGRSRYFDEGTALPSAIIAETWTNFQAAQPSGFGYKAHNFSEDVHLLPAAPSASPQTNWQSQATWYIDPANSSGVASDSNSGVDASHPVLSYNGGIVAKWGTNSPTLRQDTTLTWMSSQSSGGTDPIVLNPICGLKDASTDGAIISIVGQTTLVHSGTLGTVTAKSRATGQLLQVDLQYSPTLVAGRSLLVKNTTAGKISFAWLYPPSGDGHTWNLSQPLAPIALPLGEIPTINEIDTWSIGDTYELYDLPHVNLVQCEPLGAALNGTLSYPAPVQMLNVGVYAGNELNSDGTTLLDNVTLNACFFDTTITGNFTTGGDLVTNIFNCYLAGSVTTRNEQTTMSGGILLSPIVGSYSDWSYDYDCILDNVGGITIGLPTFGQGIGTVFLGLVYLKGSFNYIVGQDVSAHGHISGGNIWWGPGTVDVASNARLVYSSGSATVIFLQAGGLQINGQTTASTYNNSTGVWTANIALTPANLDDAGQFNGLALRPGGGTITGLLAV